MENKTTKNEVQVTFGDKLQDELIAVQTALPKDFNRTRFITEALSVINGNPDLQKCNRASIMECLLKGAFLGLSFANKEVYAIPYNGVCTFQLDYKGSIKFTKKYSTQPIKDIYAKVVREGDTFVEKIVDGHPSIDFTPQAFNDGEIKGAFAVCIFEDGTMIYETMSNKDIQNVRNNYSRASQSKAWKYSFDEMAKKTVLRRLCKHIPTDFESVEAHNAWEDGSGMEFNNNAPAVDKTNIVNAFAPKAETPTEEITVEAKDVTEDIEIPENFK